MGKYFYVSAYFYLCIFAVFLSGKKWRFIFVYKKGKHLLGPKILF